MIKTNIILVIILILVAAVAYTIMNQTETDNYFFSQKIEIENVEKIILQFENNEIFDLNQKNDFFVFKETEIEKTEFESFFEKINTISVQREFDNLTNLAELGLENPHFSVTVYLDNGKYFNVAYGRRNPSNTGIYCLTENRIYIVDTFFYHEAREFRRKLND